MSQEPSPATLGEANWQRLVKRLRDMRAYGGRDYECMDDAADMIVQMADHIALLVAATSARSEMGTPDVEQAVKWLESSAKHDDEQTLFGNADQARKIIKILRAFPSAIARKPQFDALVSAALDSLFADRGLRYPQSHSDMRLCLLAAFATYERNEDLP